MNSTVGKCVALVLAFAAGCGISAYVAQRRVQRLEAERLAVAGECLSYFRALGFGNVGNRLPTVAWAEPFRGQLEEDLKRPLEPGVNNTDIAWGFAYLTLRDDGSWNYREGMSEAEQDARIRYMCYRIRKGLCFPSLLSPLQEDECRALLSCPRAALRRNAALLEGTARYVFSVPFHGSNVVTNVERLLTHLLDEPWAQELYWDHFKWAAGGGAYVEPWFGNLQKLIARSRGVVDSHLAVETSAEVQAAAQDMIRRIKSVKWTEEQGVPRQTGESIEFVIARDIDKAFERPAALPLSSP